MTTEDTPMTPVAPVVDERKKALDKYKERLLKHREMEAKVRNLRMELRDKNKEYDKTPFGGRVLDFEWEDHHSPTLALLVNACSKMLEFLSSDPENVCFVHCNAGKGRTGTLICCYLMFCNFVENAQDAITYYGWKRFHTGKGVT